MRRAFFLDRDGVINKATIINNKPFPPLKIINAQPVKGVKELIEKIHDLGYIAIVVTNQPDVGNHVIKKTRVETINNYLKSLVNFDDAFVCYHLEEDKCECRKPKPGLLIEAAINYNIDLKHSYMVGDRWKDIEAGKAVGCKTIFVDYDYDEKRPTKPDYTVKDIRDILKILELEQVNSPT